MNVMIYFLTTLSITSSIISNRILCGREMPLHLLRNALSTSLERILTVFIIIAMFFGARAKTSSAPLPACFKKSVSGMTLDRQGVYEPLKYSRSISAIFKTY